MILLLNHLYYFTLNLTLKQLLHHHDPPPPPSNPSWAPKYSTRHLPGVLLLRTIPPPHPPHDVLMSPITWTHVLKVKHRRRLHTRPHSYEGSLSTAPRAGCGASQRCAWRPCRAWPPRWPGCGAAGGTWAPTCKRLGHKTPRLKGLHGVDPRDQRAPRGMHMQRQFNG